MWLRQKFCLLQISEFSNYWFCLWTLTSPLSYNILLLTNFSPTHFSENIQKLSNSSSINRWVPWAFIFWMEQQKYFNHWHLNSIGGNSGRLRLYTRRHYHGVLHRAVYSPKIKKAFVRIAHLCIKRQCNNKVEEEQYTKILYK